MKFKVVIAFLTVFSLLLSGCGESEEQKRFRAELINKALNDETRKAGNEFLEQNRQREGVVVLPSGLQYEVLQSGEGHPTGLRDRVELHFEGRTIDQALFDSSYERKTPLRVELTKVLDGWREALLKMVPGDIWMLYLPADLAYGATSPSEGVPANSALIFKLEVISVTPYGEEDNEQK